MKVLIECQVCGFKQRKKAPGEFSDWFDNLPEPLRCQSCGRLDSLELTVEADGK